MAKRLTKDAFITALPVFLAVVPLIVSVCLFVFALLCIEISGGLGVKEQTPPQEFLQTTGDISASLAYLTFSIIVPLGIIAAFVLAAWRLTANWRQK